MSDLLNPSKPKQNTSSLFKNEDTTPLTNVKSTFIPSTLGSNTRDKQRFSRVLSQVKLLEGLLPREDNPHETASKVIKTLRKQAKMLKKSRKKILQSSCSMTDYQMSMLDV